MSVEVDRTDYNVDRSRRTDLFSGPVDSGRDREDFVSDLCFHDGQSDSCTRGTSSVTVSGCLLSLLPRSHFTILLFSEHLFILEDRMFFLRFALGVLMLYFWLYFENMVFRCFSVLMVLLAAEFFATDYSSMGLLMILFCYCFYNENLKRDISLAAVNVLMMGGRQMFAVLSLIPLHLYSGEKGRDMKKIFYLFYPLHLALLAGIRWWIEQ